MQRKSFSVPSYVPDWGWPELLIAARCLITGRIVSGQAPSRFAESVRSELGMRYAIPVNRARFAIQSALEAMGIREGDEVVLPSYVCEAALEPVLNVGATPVFADTGPDLHLTVETVRRAITENTRCVIVAHLFGNVAPVDEIEDLLKDKRIFLIDDAAQSFGARRAGRPTGTFGSCGIIGCGPGKSLAVPAGGLLVTNNQQIYEHAAAASFPRENLRSVVRRYLAFWAWFRFRRYFLRFKKYSDAVLPQSRKSGDRPGAMSNLDASLALRQQRVWKRNASRRRRDAEPILKALGRSGKHCITDLSPSGVALRIAVILPSGGVAVDEAIERLAVAGIEARRGYDPLHRSLPEPIHRLPVTDALSNRTLLMPISKRLNTRRRRRLLRQLGETLSSSGVRSRED